MHDFVSHAHLLPFKLRAVTIQVFGDVLTDLDSYIEHALKIHHDAVTECVKTFVKALLGEYSDVFLEVMFAVSGNAHPLQPVMTDPTVQAFLSISVKQSNKDKDKDFKRIFGILVDNMLTTKDLVT